MQLKIFIIYALLQFTSCGQNLGVTKLGPCTAQLDDGRIIDLGNSYFVFLTI
jgi:hypothetical protein